MKKPSHFFDLECEGFYYYKFLWTSESHHFHPLVHQEAVLGLQVERQVAIGSQLDDEQVGVAFQRLAVADVDEARRKMELIRPSDAAGIVPLESEDD